jgi:hypothetical protein
LQRNLGRTPPTSIATFELSYSGSDADQHALDFYDVAEALLGFQRSLALTVHLVINDEVITQAPSLKGATIMALPPERGSWTFLAVVSLAGTALYKLGTTKKDTVVGHAVASAYDYVVSQLLGFHVDFDKTLGQQYSELQASQDDLPKLTSSRLDSVAEKCEVAVKNLHRPIVGERTAKIGRIVSKTTDTKRLIGPQLSAKTYEHIAFTTRSDAEDVLTGRITSYNSNTYKGRLFVPSLARPIPFELVWRATIKTAGW